MARVEIYNGHSSIIPILIHTSDVSTMNENISVILYFW